MNLKLNISEVNSNNNNNSNSNNTKHKCIDLGQKRFSLLAKTSTNFNPKQQFSFRANSLGYNINFFDIARAQKYFKYNPLTHRFNFTDKTQSSSITTTNLKTPTTKKYITISTRNYSFSNNKTSYTNTHNKKAPISNNCVCVFPNSKKQPLTPKTENKSNKSKAHATMNHQNKHQSKNTNKNKRIYTPVYNKLTQHKGGINYFNGARLNSLSENNINANIKTISSNDDIYYNKKKSIYNNNNSNTITGAGDNNNNNNNSNTISSKTKYKINRIHVYQTFKTITHKKMKQHSEFNDDIIPADLISPQERQKVLLYDNHKYVKVKTINNNNNGGNNNNNNNNSCFTSESDTHKQKILKIKTKRLHKKKDLLINTNECGVSKGKDVKIKQVVKLQQNKKKQKGIHNVTTSNTHSNKFNDNNNNNRYDDMNNHNHNHINTDNLRSFNSESNYMNGSQTQTHFKNKYKNLFDNYFSSNNFDDNTDCITSYI